MKFKFPKIPCICVTCVTCIHMSNMVEDQNQRQTSAQQHKQKLDQNPQTSSQAATKTTSTTYILLIAHNPQTGYLHGGGVWICGGE